MIIRPGNRLTLLRNGAQFFPALIAAIDAAWSTVHLESYIFQLDESGTAVLQACERAAARGVRVRLLLDGFGSSDLTETRLQRMRDAGIEVLIYRPEVARLVLKRYRLRRLHRKIAVIDEKIAFVGGINIVDDLSRHSLKAPRLDYAVSIEGPLIADILRSVRRLWTLISWLNFRTSRAFVEDAIALPQAGTTDAAFVIRDNFRHRRDIEQAYLDAINGARSEIIIANPYFMPGIHFRRALMDAAARGVRVVLLLQGRIEYFLVYFATLAFYGQLLRAGITIYEYRKSLLHAKVAVIDGEWATVGSSNIDPFSLLLAREANVVARDRAFALKLRQSLLADIESGARRVRSRLSWRQKIVRKSLSWISYGILRALMGITGYTFKEPGA